MGGAGDALPTRSRDDSPTGTSASNLPKGRYLFCRSAAVLGSSNVSAPKTQECCQILPARKLAAPEDGPEDGRTPLNRCVAGRHWRMTRAIQNSIFKTGSEMVSAAQTR